MNDDKAFFDSDVLLYLYGGPDPEKCAKAKDLFRRYARAGGILSSIPVIQEFYLAASRNLGMPHRQMREAIRALLELPLVSIGPGQIQSAILTEEHYGISFWDALMVAAAESGGAGVVFTERLNHGRQYGKVLVRNPFRAVEDIQP